MDSAIANNSKFNQGDSSYIFEKYWSNNENERRKKLMPFFWNTIVNHGQIYGNRKLDNKVNNANPHWFSYPGYSEIMTVLRIQRSTQMNFHLTLMLLFWNF
jgi:hypothetical protein